MLCDLHSNPTLVFLATLKYFMIYTKVSQASRLMLVAVHMFCARFGVASGAALGNDIECKGMSCAVLL